MRMAVESKRAWIRFSENTFNLPVTMPGARSREENIETLMELVATKGGLK